MFSLGAEKEDTFINDATYYWQFYVTVLSHGTLTGWNPVGENISKQFSSNQPENLVPHVSEHINVQSTWH